MLDSFDIYATIAFFIFIIFFIIFMRHAIIFADADADDDAAS